MQFQIPQFIEVEDKIFGPLTFKQFVYIIGGLGAAYLLYRVLPVIVALPLMGIVLALGAALAFFEYNGRPFIIALEYGFSYLIHPKLYLWNNERKRRTVVAKKTAEPEAKSELYIPKLSDSKLHELSWSLDIKERIAAGVATDEEKLSSGGVVAPVETMRGLVRQRTE